MSTYKLSVISPEGQVFQGQVEFLSAPGQEGSFGVLAQHAPMIAALKAGTLRVKDQSQEKSFVIEPGVLEVDSNHNVVVLVDQAQPA